MMGNYVGFKNHVLEEHLIHDFENSYDFFFKQNLWHLVGVGKCVWVCMWM